MLAAEGINGYEWGCGVRQYASSARELDHIGCSNQPGPSMQITVLCLRNQLGTASFRISTVLLLTRQLNEACYPRIAAVLFNRPEL